MIERIIAFALHQRFITLALALLLTVGGVVSWSRLPIEAYPDVADVQVDVITIWPGRAAEEVLRHLSEQRPTGHRVVREVQHAAVEVARPLTFAVLIILAVYVPIVTFRPRRRGSRRSCARATSGAWPSSGASGSGTWAASSQRRCRRWTRR